MTATLLNPQTAVSQARTDTHNGGADGTNFPSANARARTHLDVVEGNSTSEDGGHRCPDAQVVIAPVLGLTFLDILLKIAADAMDDLERTRIATSNRMFQIKDNKLEDAPSYKALGAMLAGIEVLEKSAELNLKRTLRLHPLGSWVKATEGIGEKQGARLIASIGDPYWHRLYDRPRTVSELWALCGYHVLPASHGRFDTQIPHAGGAQSSGGGDTSPGRADTHSSFAGVAAARVKGQKANWNADAKMRAYLVAESCTKAIDVTYVIQKGKHAGKTVTRTASPYRAIYDTARLKYADAVHHTECRRCGPKGKPALIGSPISAGHQHARALRIVAKEILKDLWRASKAIHEQAAQPDHIQH